MDDVVYLLINDEGEIFASMEISGAEPNPAQLAKSFRDHVHPDAVLAVMVVGETYPTPDDAEYVNAICFKDGD